VSAKHVIAALAAVALAAFAFHRRGGLGRGRTALALLGAVLLGVYASGVLPPLPDVKGVITDIAKALGPWTYALVGVMAFLETGAFVGLIAPGETVVLVGGVIAGQGEIDLFLLIGLVWTCAILGDTTSFFIGRRLGRSFLERHGPRVKITSERLHQVDGYFERHGGKTILIGRFIGLVRAVAPFIAGSSGLAYGRFLPYSVVGTGLWGALYCVLGYVFYRSFDRVAKIAGQATFGFALVVGVVAAVVYTYRRLRTQEQRRRLSEWLDRQERSPLLRPVVRGARLGWRRVVVPLGRAVAPAVRFFWERLTPGGLGLEFTTALAVVAVGVYVFVLYTVTLSGDPGPTTVDSHSLDLADRLRTDVAVDIAKVVTGLGAFATVATLVGVTAVALAVRRHGLDAAALVAGLLLIYVSAQLTKAGVDRPRPSSPLVHTSGQAFPSAHAAYSTAWIAVAVLVSRRLMRVAGRVSLVLIAVLLSAVVGLSRIYLRAHYWSDVAGGWALGAGLFALCAVFALVVAHIRQNAPERV
jgi:membrane protein DedA with SNARE-associated domain/membrane-associated phospholipid phosphatase